jgi:hypothetical protein
MLLTALQVADTLPGLSPTDSLLVRIVSDTDSWFKQSMDRSFERTTYALTVTANRSPFVLLRESPIRNLISASADGAVVDISKFTFNADPDEDDNRLFIAGVAVGSQLLVNVEAGWWPPSGNAHASDLPADITGKLILRARAEFKRSSGVADDETKLMTDDYILKGLASYQRQAWYD